MSLHLGVGITLEFMLLLALGMFKPNQAAYGNVPTKNFVALFKILQLVDSASARSKEFDSPSLPSNASYTSTT